MLGVPIEGSMLLFGDNKSMIMNTPGSALKKRHSAVAYHCIRESVACGIGKIIHCCSETNLSNLLTKPLGPQTFQRLVKHEQFPPRLLDEGELNGEIVNGKSVTQTKYRQLEITCPASERELTIIKIHWTAADNRLLSTQMLILQLIKDYHMFS